MSTLDLLFSFFGKWLTGSFYFEGW